MIWNPFINAGHWAGPIGNGGEDRTQFHSAGERLRWLGGACDDFRRGRFGRVVAALEQLGDCADGDAVCLNVRGVLYELGGDFESARRCYGKAIRADRHFAAAQQNMRRMYELWQFGATSQPVALGDALTDLWLARRQNARGTHA